jgi:ABC-type cobalamin/Fe3+-siderophores transport system ATPase subunit
MQVIELKAENFKRLRAIRLQLPGGVTKIVGRNGQGKTSALDAIAAALGGAAQTDDMPVRRGTDWAEVLLDLGDIKVRRRWTAAGESKLEVTTAEGARYPSPQSVLDNLVGTLCFDPLLFTRLKPSEQAGTLAKVVGLDLAGFQAKRGALFHERTLVNRDAKAARAQLDAMPAPENPPAAEVSVKEILDEIAGADEHNRQVQNQHRNAERIVEAFERIKLEAVRAAQIPDEIDAECEAQLRELEAAKARTREQFLQKRKLATEAFRRANERLTEAENQAVAAAEAAREARPVEVAPLREKAARAETVNALFRAARARAAKEAEAEALARKSGDLTEAMKTLDAQRDETIAAAALPVPGLALGEDGVLLDGIPFGQCSAAEQLRVSVAIGLALNPKLRLMLIRDGSLLDADSMTLLAELAEGADAQVLVERVAGGGETGVIIEDGEIQEAAAPATKREPALTSERG